MHRNIFHFSPEKNWMNDPNGLVYYRGEYHLFYQYNPCDIVWGPMHWGHAVSVDLMHWEHLPVALYPDPLGTIFSGSVVVDWNDSTGFFNGGSGLVAVFTHHGPQKEVQSIAYSTDNGRSWTKYKNNPVIDNPGKKDFRDPKVFYHDSSKKWIAVIACGNSICFYSSVNLISWDFESEFKDHNAVFEGPWECPDLFSPGIDGNEADKKWVLKIDIGNGALAGGSGGMYYIGEFDGKSFVRDDPGGSHKWIDYSQDFYAAQTWSDTFEKQNRHIWVGWMNNWLYANKTPAQGFRGMMSLPRELSLKKLSDELFLIQRPVREVANLRKDAVCEDNIVIGSYKSYQLDSSVKAVEISAEVQYDQAAGFSMEISFGNDETVVISVDGENEEIILDRSKSGNVGFSHYFKDIFHAPLIQVKEYIKLNIFVDMNAIEVFVDEGMITMSSLIFPRECVKSVKISAISEDVVLKNLKIYNLS